MLLGAWQTEEHELRLLAILFIVWFERIGKYL